MERPPTPQILHDPIVEPEDELSYDWYYSREAGGYVLTFGKFHGRRMHAASLSYLYWCDRTFDYDQRRRLLDAFHNFHVGLEEYVKTNYGDFIVPFGRKHRGKTISQCRDKLWLQWVMKQLSKKRVMKRKYGVFFEAVNIWLQNPRHQGVKRNIGELLDASEYEDDLDMIHEFDEDYEDNATESDLEFIVPDSEEVSVEGSESASESSAKATDTSDNDSEGDDQSESSAESTPEPEQRTHRSNRMASRHKKDDFIENDEEGDGSEEYEEAEACEPEERPQTAPPRTLRSSMRKKGLAKQARSNEYEVPDSEQRIQTSPRVLRSAKVVSKQDAVAIPIRKPRSASKTAVARSSAAKEKESEARRNVVAISPSPMLHRGHDNDGSSSDASDDKPLTQFQTPQKRSRRNVIRTPSDSEDKNEGSEGIAVPPTPSVAGSSSIRSRKYGKQYSKPPSSKLTRSQAHQKARGATDAAYQARMINDYFMNAQQPALPPDIRHALDAVASYVSGQQDCTDRNAPSDCDIEMDNT